MTVSPTAGPLVLVARELAPQRGVRDAVEREKPTAQDRPRRQPHKQRQLPAALAVGGGGRSVLQRLAMDRKVIQALHCIFP